MPPKDSRTSKQPERPLHCTHGGCDVIDRLAAYEERRTGVSRCDKEILIPALGWRSYHLPGYTYFEDWLQYFQNNHPLLSICCHHRLHPIGFGMRLVFLFGSIVFGLLITNISWLWFYYSGTDEDEPAVTITISAGGLGMSSSNNSTYAETTSTTNEFEDNIQLTKGMIFLWTFESALHALFDNTIWYVTACACCLQSKQHHRFKCCGSFCVTIIVLFATAIATLAVLLRTTIEAEAQQNDTALDSSATFEANIAGVETQETVTKIRFQDAESYSFLMSYAMELVLALVVYNPLVGTILFSGILGCGRLPILGGRPYEVHQEERRLDDERIDISSSTFGSESGPV